MLFNSFTILFLFLAVTLAVWQLLRYAVRLRIALGWLSLASLFFYAAWDISYLSILLTSNGINFWLGERILAARQHSS